MAHFWTEVFQTRYGASRSNAAPGFSDASLSSMEETKRVQEREATTRFQNLLLAQEREEREDRLERERREQRMEEVERNEREENSRILERIMTIAVEPGETIAALTKIVAQREETKRVRLQEKEETRRAEEETKRAREETRRAFLTSLDRRPQRQERREEPAASTDDVAEELTTSVRLRQTTLVPPKPPAAILLEFEEDFSEVSPEDRAKYTVVVVGKTVADCAHLNAPQPRPSSQ